MHPTICSPNHLPQHHLTNEGVSRRCWQHQDGAACVGLAGNIRSMRKPPPFPSQRNICKKVAHFRAYFHPNTSQHLGSIHQGGRDAGPDALKCSTEARPILPKSFKAWWLFSFFLVLTMKAPNQLIPQSAPAISLLPLLLMDAWKGPQSQET